MSECRCCRLSDTLAQSPLTYAITANGFAARPHARAVPCIDGAAGSPPRRRHWWKRRNR